MQSTGIVRHTDIPGRIVIPKEVRDALNIHPNDLLEVFTEGDMILFKKYMVGCIFCNKTFGLKGYMTYKICTKCISEVSELL